MPPCYGRRCCSLHRGSLVKLPLLPPTPSDLRFCGGHFSCGASLRLPAAVNFRHITPLPTTSYPAEVRIGVLAAVGRSVGGVGGMLRRVVLPKVVGSAPPAAVWG